MDDTPTTVERRILRVANTLAALDLTGFSRETAEGIVGRLGGAEIEWVPVPFNQLFSPLHSPFDFAVQLVTITPERASIVDFSDPYVEVSQALLARRDSPLAAARRLEEVRKHRLGADTSTTAMACLRSLVRPVAEPEEFSSVFLAAKAVADGGIDGAVFDAPIAIALSKQFPGTTVVGQLGAREQCGVLFDKGSPLREPVSRALNEMKADGTLSRLLEKWFPGIENLPELT
jgi:polar amino acid transport system substrate-binding protein